MTINPKPTRKSSKVRFTHRSRADAAKIRQIYSERTLATINLSIFIADRLNSKRVFDGKSFLSLTIYKCSLYLCDVLSRKGESGAFRKRTSAAG